MTATETPVLTRPVTPTFPPTPTATPYLTFTPLPYRTPQGEFIHYVSSYSFSPDGEWVEWSLCCSNTGNHMLVEEINGTRMHQEFYDPDDYPWPEAYFKAENWSTDGNYLYYGVYPAFDGGCGNFSLTGDLQRLDLGSGETSRVLPYETDTLFEFSISPSGAFVAHSAPSSEGMHVSILNLANGQEQSIILDTYEAPVVGRMLWSPEETFLFFEVIVDISSSSCSSVFVLLDVETMLFREITVDIVNTLWPIEWKETTTIIFGAAPAGDPLELELDFETGELTPATPQP